MKYFPFLISLLLISCSSQNKDSVEGVYKTENTDTNQLWMLVDGYSSKITFKDHQYISTKGGTYDFEKNKLLVNTEFDDNNPSKIGEQSKHQLTFEGDNFKDETGTKWIKQPYKSQKLDGLWKISGRQNKDEFIKINHSGSRKTIKLLKDGYFQWIAIEPEAKKFFGSGGGKYSFKDGKYTEQIIYFSKDDSRVGAELSFDGELIDGEWHHSGKSSKGDPIHEVWIRD